MIIGIATEGNNASQHFGHCEGFTLYEVADNKINNKTFVENPGHEPGFLPKFLAGKNVNVILAGGMGRKAVELFEQNNIKVVVGVRGDIDAAMDEYLKGDLKSTGSICDHEH